MLFEICTVNLNQSIVHVKVTIAYIIHYTNLLSEEKKESGVKDGLVSVSPQTSQWLISFSVQAVQLCFIYIVQNHNSSHNKVLYVVR